MSAHPEWFLAFLARAPVRVICPDCYGQNPACRHCVGGYVMRHPYAEGSGEQGDTFDDIRPPGEAVLTSAFGAEDVGSTPAGAKARWPIGQAAGSEPAQVGSTPARAVDPLYPAHSRSPERLQFDAARELDPLAEAGHG